MTHNLRATMQTHLNATERLGLEIWRFSLYHRNVVPDLRGTVAIAIATYLVTVQTAPKDAQRLCLCCETTFRHYQTVAGISVLTEGSDADAASFVGGICLTCLQRPGLQDVIREVYQTGLGIEIRAVDSGSTG